METFWTETFTGPDAPMWPAGWSQTGSPGASSATVVSGRGRLTAGPGPESARTSVKMRFERMREQADTDTVLAFTPPDGAWYLTVGARTLDNGSIDVNYEYSNRGMFAQVSNFFGSNATFTRWGPDSWFDQVATTSTGLPAWVGGTAYKLRFRVIGHDLYLRVWPAASLEPSTWNLTATDPQAWLEPGKLTVAYTTNLVGEVTSVDVDDVAVYGLDPVLPSVGGPQPWHAWSAWSRAANYAPDVALPISSIKTVRRHMGIDAAVVETAYSPERWLSLQPSRGLVLFRDGVQEFTGLVSAREQMWDAVSGQMRIKVEAVGDAQNLADRLVFPDPLRAADDQTVNDYWMTRTGTTAVAKVASTAMWQLISDQAGPTCRADRRVPGLVMGTDPGVGLSRIWSGLFTSAGDNGVLDQLINFATVSGKNLGVRCRTAPGSLTVDVVQPRDLGDEVRFSADLRNLVGYSYREQAPTCTDGLAAGQGDLHLRLRKQVTTGSALALSWGRRIWKYLDRRDTADAVELVKEATDAVIEGDAKVSLAVTLTDSQAATYRRDWDLGDVITIYVAPPGYATSVTVTDVVREVLLEVDDKGAEKVTPAVGTAEATALPRSPTQQQLSTVGWGLAGLKSRK